MRWRGIATVALAAMGIVAGPAGAHGGGGSATERAHYPSLPGRAGSQARAVERRERAIEAAALGSEHAAEHAQGRALARSLRESAGRRGNALGPWTQELQPDNTLVAPNVGGRWEKGVQLPIVAINAVMLHTGKILYFAYPWRASELDPATGTPGQATDWDTATAYLYDPATGASKEVPPPINPTTGKRVELFCAGASLLADGRVLVTGGNVGNPAGDGPTKRNYGLNTIYTFDPDKAEAGEQPWTTGPRMRQGRWYPSQVLLQDGRTLITSGQNNVGDPDAYGVNRDLELYDADSNVLEPLGQFRGAASTADPYVPGVPGQYPHMFLMPSGKILNAGPFKLDSWLLDRPGLGAQAGTFTDLPDLDSNREWAGAVQLPGGTSGSSKVMLLGGSDRTDDSHGPVSAPLATTTYFDETRPNQGWRVGPTLNSPRAFANTVLLPDSKVAVVGGGIGERSEQRYYRWIFEPEEKRIEILDPKTLSPATKPTLGNAQAEGRTYHSTALLLPDGRLWSAGDDINGPFGNPTAADPNGYSGGALHARAQQLGAGSGVCTDTAEVWTPPYLLNADGSAKARPSITDAPRSGTYGATLGVRTSSSATKAVLVAPGATTHAADMSQRIVSLDVTKVAGRGLNVTLPSTASIAPPSWYMLFVLDANGTPSVSRFVQLVPPGAPRAAPDPLSSGDPATREPAQPTVPTPTAAPAGQRTGCDATGSTPPAATPTPAPAPAESPAPAASPTPSPEPIFVPTPVGGEPVKARFRTGVQLSLASTLARLRQTKRLSVIVTTTRPAAVTVKTGIEYVTGSGKRARRTVLPLARTQRAALRKAGSKRVRVTLNANGLRRLGAVTSARLVITVRAKPAKGKAVTVKRRPVLR